MNFFGHAVVAGFSDQEPRFVLGAMLPDFAGMVGARVRVVHDPMLKAGIEHHHRTDAAFHSSPVFVTFMHDTMQALEAVGLARGPARATSHVGIELLLDGLFAHEATRVVHYKRALNVATHMDDLNSIQGLVGIGQLVQRLLSAPIPDGYRDVNFVVQRVQTILSPRPRLRWDTTFAHAVHRVMATAQEKLRAQEARLLIYLREQLDDATSHTPS